MRCGHVTIPSSLNVLSASRSRSGGGHSPSPVLPALFSCTPRPFLSERYYAVCLNVLTANRRWSPTHSNREQLVPASFTVSAVRSCFTYNTANTANALCSQGSLHDRISYRPSLVPAPMKAFSRRDVDLALSTGTQWGPKLGVL